MRSLFTRRRAAALVGLAALALLSACSVKTVPNNQYQLNAYCDLASPHKSAHTILISPTEASAAYQGKDMFYVKRPFEMQSFAYSTWVSPPAEMLAPLIVQSVQRSCYFKAVLSNVSDAATDYRLDTQLLELQQNFLENPSVIQLSVRAVLTDVHNNQIIASQLFKQQVPCSDASPYGGVVAANRATRELTGKLVHFILRHM